MASRAGRFILKATGRVNVFWGHWIFRRLNSYSQPRAVSGAGKIIKSIFTCNLPVLKFWSRPKVAFGGPMALQARKNYSMWDEKVAIGCIVPGSPKWKSRMKR